MHSTILESISAGSNAVLMDNDRVVLASDNLHLVRGIPSVKRTVVQGDGSPSQEQDALMLFWQTATPDCMADDSWLARGYPELAHTTGVPSRELLVARLTTLQYPCVTRQRIEVM